MNNKNSGNIRWGIIGCGNVTEVKSGPAFNQVPGSSLVAVMRRDGAKAKDYARRHGVPKWYDDASDIINDPGVDAIYVATPPDTHALYAIQVLEAGKPVYVEKPMGHSYLECIKMIEVSQRVHRPLYVAYYRRQLPYFLKIRELLEAGVIGNIRQFNMQLLLPPRSEDLSSDNLPWRVRQNIAGAGYFYDLASHQLDLVDFFFGPVSSAVGTTRNQAGLYEPEDAVAALLEFDSGIMGVGQWSFAVHESAATDIFEIVGSNGKLTFSTFGFSPILLENHKGRELFDIRPPATIQQAFIHTMVHELLDSTYHPGNCVTAARTNKIMDDILGRNTDQVNQHIPS
jgi:predicted dehydrogenase